ncbi:hypothetical protein ACJJIC_15655 [Microbulbifer sp. ANSA002]|uniref:hypothetical protein n=1 Tax=unclassified Microbulbifer TaxID=2619833 RepID=UPI0040426F54
MKDQTIYQEVAKLLYLEAPDVSSEVHALVRYFKESSMISVWVGELRSTAGGFALSYEAGTRVSDLVGELKAYYVEKNMGDWNVAHFIAIPHAKKFELEFNYCEELENGDVTFSKYAKRLNQSSRIHQE